MNLISCLINNESSEFRTFIIIMVVVVYNADFFLIPIVITMITVPITTIIIAMLVILVFIIVVITLRTINFIKIYFSIYSIIFFNIFPYQFWTKRFNDRGALWKIMLDDHVTTQRFFNCSIKFPFMMLAILKCFNFISLVHLNSLITFGIFAALTKTAKILKIYMTKVCAM